jgi:tetratricopeptide (TPR) repeat protein
MSIWRALFSGALCVASVAAQPATVLVARFNNHSQYADLNWVGESIAETLRAELASADQIVLEREDALEGMKRLGLRSDAVYTKASLIRLGQALGADFICYGSFDATLPASDANSTGAEGKLKNSSVQITASYIDLRKMHDGPDIAEAGKLADLSRLEEHLAWQSVKYVDPASNPVLDQFLTPAKFIRLDAKESYIRGLMSSDREQRRKWFAQAAALDPQFVRPAFELGKSYLDGKDYSQALHWFDRVPANHPRYPEARFDMGLSAYKTGDYNSAVTYFREVLNLYPLTEVYNDLGASELHLKMPTAVTDFRHAVEADESDSTYSFNLGLALLTVGSFDDAVKRLQDVVDRDPDDSEARALLARAESHEQPSDSKPLPPERLKPRFDPLAFRQLKAMLQAKGNS